MGEPIVVDHLIREWIDQVRVRPEGDGWIGDVPSTWGGEYAFGGDVIAQAVHAATRAAPEGRRIHSLHAYFLNPIKTGRTASYRASSLRDGRSFTTRHLETVQDDVLPLTMMCSFTADTDGYEYQLPMDEDVPEPDGLDATPGPGPWISARLGPTEPRPDGSRRSTYRAWYRVNGTLPNDPHLHAALVGFATDWTGTGGRPLHLEGDPRGMISLDHAVWFHRPLRADEWFFYEVESLVNAGGRGLLRGRMYGNDRCLAVSVAQEMILRPV